MDGNVTIRPDPDVVACELGDGLALLNLQTSTYYSLNKVGAAVWEALQERSSAQDISLAVSERFTVTSERCAADVDELLGQMIDARLAHRDQ
ncbi:PqqD family protein [Aurantiacibacter poecillastricola]|uniref:PqqD family protein n=1 Tax=Aurantiacibacter poecillastricola TaxID=3064385 RepID=UPI00273F9DFA|nr:PqqD family protein [Aurantiacibacter sp. 219JJ12-13]MDP5263230.1 PqqD family protein [Aurantiacibacter sp. 219JJ12-13]